MRLLLPSASDDGRSVVLRRHPDDGTDRWRAWDAADELALAHLAPLLALDRPGPPTVLVRNDRWGALASGLLALAPAARVHTLVESRTSELALAANLAANGLGSVRADHPNGTRPVDPPARADAVVVKVPRSLALLEDQLAQLRPHLGPDTVVVGAGMTRHIHTSTVDAFAAIGGPTSTTRAVKKARLILTTPDPAVEPPAPAPTRTWTHDGIEVVARPGVFSADHLDAGTRLLLDHLPAAPPGARALDLGCGTGVLGVALARRHPDAHVTFVDDSYRAVASAEATWRATLGDPEARARFLAGDVIDDLVDVEGHARDVGPASLDLVLCNPPFHDDHAVGDAIAWRMFRAAHDALRAGGELWVVGNRHLGYHAKLARVFGEREVVASTPTFTVLRAVRSGAGGGARTRRSP